MIMNAFRELHFAGPICTSEGQYNEWLQLILKKVGDF